VGVWRSAKQERAYLILAMRAEGKTWVEIAGEFRDRYSVNARKALRWAHGWSQDDVAKEWCRRWPDEPRTGQNISTWERWPESGHEPSISTLTRLARIYECDLSHLVADLGRFSHLDSANAGPIMDSVSELTRHTAVPGDDEAASHKTTDRREFTTGAVLAALGLTEPLRELITARTTDSSAIIGAEHIRLVQAAVERIEAHDSALGAADLRVGVGGLRQQVEQWLNGANYTVHRGADELQALLGELNAWAGWLAFDADDHDGARRYLQDALVQARLTDDPQLEVRALSYICLVTRDRRPQQSLQCAEAALRLARGWATPRLTTLLHLRAARAHATLREPKAFGREIANAKGQLDRGVHDDDPLYVHFVTPQEVAGITGLSHLAMGDPRRAATEFRALIENPDHRYERNRGYYTVRLAEAVAQQHDIRQASEIGLSAIPLVTKLGSGRTARHLHALRTTIEPHRATIPVAQDFTDAYDEAFAP
jgi:transcriptional regulator with XRE-family HTH domain